MNRETRREVMAAGIGSALTAAILVVFQHYVIDAPRSARAHVLATRLDAAPLGVATPEQADEPWKLANANLAETVRLAQQRLERNEAERKDLEGELREAKAKLVARAGDGAALRDEYDLTRDDWKELAKTGTVKARYPCDFGPDWHVTAEVRDRLGLSPQDAVVVEKAVKDEEERLAKTILTGCGVVLGDVALARRLGPEVCAEVVSHAVKEQGPDLHLVADIRAGNVPMPGAEKIDPFAAMMLAQTGALDAVQADLTGTFGADEAHRLAFAKPLGGCSGVWGP